MQYHVFFTCHVYNTFCTSKWINFVIESNEDECKRVDHIKASDVAAMIEEFESRCRHLNENIYTELVSNHVSASSLLINLTFLPVKFKEYEKAIQDKIKEITTPHHSINELFYRVINPLLSFFDYGLLQHMIVHFGSVTLKKEMELYVHDVQLFMNETRIHDLIDHLPGKLEAPPNFEILRIKIGKDANKCTLAEINSIRRRLCGEVKLSDIVFRLIALEDSTSFIVSFLVPALLVPSIIAVKSAQKIDSCFQREKIAYMSIGNRWIYNPKLFLFGAQLRQEYKQSLVNVPPSDLIPSPTEKVFRLAMIQREKLQQGQLDDKFVRMTISGRVDDILHAKVPVKLEYIFKNLFHGSEIVLIEGAPGSGKSTLTVHICKKWGKSELYEQFSVVILVQLRDPAIQNAQSISDILPCQNVGMSQEYASEIIATNGRGILWVLDGWDELPSDLQQDSLFRRLLPSTVEAHQHKMLSESSVIVTSRPISSGKLQALASSRIEVLGFTPEEQVRYFTECLKGDLTALGTLLEKINENPVVQSICYLPLNAAFVVHAFTYHHQSIPSTVYEIYLSVIVSIVRRHFNREHTDHDLPDKLVSLDDISRSKVAGECFLHLCQMALHGVMKNKVTFSSSEFREGCSTLSLLQGIQSFLGGGNVIFYNFIHLVIQEILSAHYLATHVSHSEQVSQFLELFSQPRFAAVFQYYSAITKLKTPGILDVITKIVREKSRTHVASLFRCLYEAQDSSLCLYVAEQLGYVLDLGSVSLSPLDCFSVSFFVSCVIYNKSHCNEVIVGLSDCNIGDQGIDCLTKYLINDINIGQIGRLSMILDNNSISGLHGVQCVTKMLSSGNIAHLYLSGNPLGDTGASIISNAVSELRSLKTLVIFGCHITSQGIEELSIALCQNQYLEKWDLGYNNIGDNGIKHIAEVIKENRQLKELWIGGCGITDEGLACLTKALKVNNTLRLLEMGETETFITEKALSKLIKSLNHNTVLRKLVVPEHHKEKLNNGNIKIEHLPIEIIGECSLFVCMLGTHCLRMHAPHTSLVPRPRPVFQCCTLKNRRAWYLNDIIDNGHFLSVRADA